MLIEKKTFPKIGMKFEFRGTQFCRNRREEAFERSRPKGKRPVAGHSPGSGFYKSTTVGDKWQNELLDGISTLSLTDVEAEKKIFFASNRR